MVEIIHPGSYSSIQDLGRWGVQRYGIPISGAMDHHHAVLANELVGNEPHDAVIECTWKGPDLYFHCAALIAISGAIYQPTLNGRQVRVNQCLTLQKGDLLQLGIPNQGMRGYLAVMGGFQTEPIMGSRSTYGALHGVATLKKGVQLPINEVVPKIPSHANLRQQPFKETNKVITILPGPELNTLTSDQQQRLFVTAFTLDPQSNRMAILLNGNEEIGASEILTAPVQPGTVQLTPSGKCVVLMRDAQTTGGYARIGQLTNQAMNLLSQKRPGEIIHLQLG